MENLPNELNVELFIKLDYPSLINLCLTNKSIHKFCQSEYFWERKMDLDYPGLTQYRPNGMTYQEQYRTLYYLPTLEQSLKDGRIDQLTLHNEPTREDLNIPVSLGNISMLNWAFDNLELLPNSEAYYYAAINNQYETLDWLYQHRVAFPEEIEIEGLIFMFEDAIIYTMGYQSLPVLLWLEHHGYDLSQWFPDTAAAYGVIPLLEWLESNRRVLPTVDGANMAVSNNKIQVLKWLERRDILPDEEGAREALGHGHLDLVIWMSSYLKPHVGWANMAAANNQINILNWLESKGVLPNVEGYNMTVRRGQYQVLDWMEKRGIYGSLK